MLLTALAPSALASHRELDARADLDVEGSLARADADVDARTSVTWDWGDGERSHGRRASHRYEAGGEYEVLVTYERRGGECWTERRLVRIDAVDKEEGDDGEAEEGASLRLGVPAVSARVEVGGDRARGDDDRAHARWESETRVSSESYDRHDVPGAALPLAAGVVALAALLVRRR